jgi:quercetin dioxygenase-like cupin family protein
MQAGRDREDWLDELDALVAAPKHHALLFENEAVRVLDTRVGPGNMVPLHTHRWPSTLYILSWSDFVRRDPAGAVVVDSRTGKKLPAGTAVWSTPLEPHTLENVGTSELRAISVEVKGGGRGAK